MKRNETPAMITLRLPIKDKLAFEKAVLRKDRTLSQVLRAYIRRYIGRK